MLGIASDVMYILKKIYTENKLNSQYKIYIFIILKVEDYL